MAYYLPGLEIVVFGGDTPYSHGSQRGLGGTWVFGAHGWARLLPRHSPPPRRSALMAYDPVTRLLLFAGDSAEFQPTSAGARLLL